MKTITAVGLGLRHPHLDYVLDHSPSVPWFEILTDNFFSIESLPFHKLSQIAERYPLCLHGVGLSLGSMDPLDQTYLTQLKKLIDLLNPVYVSEHLSWSSLNGEFFHELFPLPFTEEALNHVVDRISQAQDFLSRSLLIENISSYYEHPQVDYSEAEFVNEVAARSGCHILLDINNIFVSAHNHGWDAETYLQKITPKHVAQFHLGGYWVEGDLLIDTHGAAVSEEVWQLYAKALAKFSALPTLIEWDNHIPAFPQLLLEQERATALWKKQCQV